ncbi:MAG: hypothetical protein ACLTBF_11625 [Christensenellales bacterium]
METAKRALAAVARGSQRSGGSKRKNARRSKEWSKLSNDDMPNDAKQN